MEILQADAPADLTRLFAAMRAALSDGRHLAGYASYELGLSFEPRLSRLARPDPSVPLAWFGVFPEPPRVLEGDALEEFWSFGRYHAGRLEPEWTAGEHAERVRATQALIAAGDVFQANLTFRARFGFRGDVRAFYRDLRAQARGRHGALVADGRRDILSLSPELFFEIAPDGSIGTAPMKGTISRGADHALDETLRLALAASIKDRAENLMIVDLLRNDLGRIAEIGSVSVDALFGIETYPTLHTMVSRISARLAGDRDPETILRALFPCGSITGAPKIRAMEIIADLEASPRGVYCGAIGHFAPDGAARFNVAIRTATIEAGAGELGIGGAITADSTAEAEWSEALLKAAFFDRARRPLELVETLRFDGGVFHRLERHLDRMAASAAFFGIGFRRDAALRTLHGAVAGKRDPTRCRLVLGEDGRFAATAVPLEPTRSSWRSAISPTRIDSDDVFLRHKTGWRELYDGEQRRMAARFGTDEVLFLNERGELCEGSRSNLFLRIGDRLLTPSCRSGLLPGCLRREMLDAGMVAEAILGEEDLRRATRVMAGNSLRGLVPMTLVDTAEADVPPARHRAYSGSSSSARASASARNRRNERNENGSIPA